MPLDKTAQLDFAAGIVRATARHLIPPNGAYDMRNTLLDDDGSDYKRGGSELLSTSDFGSSGLRFIWDGQLGAGARTVIANTSDFGVLDGSEAPVNLGGAGLTDPVRGTEIGGMLFIDGGVIYGGSRKTADYSTGTVSVTNGSTTVTGAGTTWNTLTDVGMLLRVAGTGRYYVVASITDVTHLELSEPYEGGTAAGQAYVLSLLGSTATAPYRTSSAYFTAADRLFSLESNKAYFSAPGDPNSFDATDYHEFPEGVRLLGGAGLGDRAYVFHTGGLSVITNLHFDLTDADGNAQQTVEPLSRDLILWSKESISTWRGALVAACADGVWLIPPDGAPVLLSRSITPLYGSYVKAGYRTGLGAVYRSHYFLPILDSSNVVVDLLVCRLDRPVQVQGFGRIYPWTRFLDSGGNVAGLAVRVSSSATRSPELLAAGRQTSSRVLKLTGAFDPVAGRKNDHDATTPEWQIVTRDYATGPLNRNQVRKLRARYELIDAASDDPTIALEYSVGVLQATTGYNWGENWGTLLWAEEGQGEFTAVAGQAPEDDGRNPFPWSMSVRARYIRFRLRSTDPCTRLTLRSLEMFVRQNTRDR